MELLEKAGLAFIPVLLMIVLLGQLTPARAAEAGREQEGLLIVVTFPCLKYDVELLACEGDVVVPLVPQGADPHEYQLTPEDVSLLEDADVIISTAHAPFEAKIRELAEAGEIRGRLVEIPAIPGLRLLKNPSTGQENYHMPIYDPYNYRVFMAYLSEVLSDGRPGRAAEYGEKASEVLRAVDELLSGAPELGARAAADMPVVQYAVSWLGVEIEFLVVKEPGAPATPGDLLSLREAMSEGEVDLVVLCEPVVSSASRRLEEMASEYGVPVLYVPSPLEARPILDKLSDLAERARGLNLPEQQEGIGAADLILVLLSTFLVATTLTAVMLHARG